MNNYILLLLIIIFILYISKNNTQHFKEHHISNPNLSIPELQVKKHFQQLSSNNQQFLFNPSNEMTKLRLTNDIYLNTHLTPH